MISPTTLNEAQSLFFLIIHRITFLRTNIWYSQLFILHFSFLLLYKYSLPTIPIYIFHLSSSLLIFHFTFQLCPYTTHNLLLQFSIPHSFLSMPQNFIVNLILSSTTTICRENPKFCTTPNTLTRTQVRNLSSPIS